MAEHPGPSWKRHSRRLLAVALLVAGLLSSVLALRPGGPLRRAIYQNRYHVATIISRVPWPTAADVTRSRAVPMVPEAAGEADPFLFARNGRYFLFMELVGRATSTGTLAVSQSADGVNWSRPTMVLREKYHLSYPCVFEWRGAVYMVPESSQAGRVSLYRASSFPLKWVREATLIHEPFVDSSVFVWGGALWMLTYDNRAKSLRLFSSPSPRGPWAEHPRSPLTTGDATISRPGGRVRSIGGMLYRVAQDDLPEYGESLRAFRIDLLTPKAYREHQVTLTEWSRDPDIVRHLGHSHHLDRLEMPDGYWLVAVDFHVLRLKSPMTMWLTLTRYLHRRHGQGS